MGVQRQVYRRVKLRFPEDFPQRLERFKEASGLTWRSLARLLGVSPYRVREWRRGIVPSSTHLFFLLTLADGMERKGILMSPERDLPDGVGSPAVEIRLVAVSLDQKHKSSDFNTWPEARL